MRYAVLIIFLLMLVGCWGTAAPTAVVSNPTHIAAQANPEAVVQLRNDLYLAERYAEMQPLYTPEWISQYTDNGQRNFAEQHQNNPLGQIDHILADPAVYADAEHAQIQIYNLYYPDQIKDEFTQSTILYLERRNGLWYICGADDANSTTPYGCPSPTTP